MALLLERVFSRGPAGALVSIAFRLCPGPRGAVCSSHSCTWQTPCCCWWPPGIERPSQAPVGERGRTNTNALNDCTPGGWPSPGVPGRPRKWGPAAATSSFPWLSGAATGTFPHLGVPCLLKKRLWVSQPAQDQVQDKEIWAPFFGINPFLPSVTQTLMAN